MRISASTILLFGVGVATASYYGQCTDEQTCGFMCCIGSEVCVDDWCYPASFVSSALVAAPTDINNSEISSIIKEIQSSEGLSSFVSEFSTIFVDGPTPSPFLPSSTSGGPLVTDIFATPSTTASTKATQVPETTERPKPTEKETTFETKSSTTESEEPSSTSSTTDEPTDTPGAGIAGYAINGGAVAVGVLGALLAAL